MPVQGFTVGRDVTVTVNGPGGNITVIPAAQITHFTKRPLKREDWSRPLNGPPIPLYMPDGWRGTFDLDRQDPTMDTFQANLEVAFYAGQNIQGGTITETITENTGSTSQYQYNGVMYWVEDPGDANADRKLMQRVDWCASQRIRTQ